MNQKGFTLLELLVAMGVGGIILIGIVLSIHQVLVGTGRSNSQVISLTDANQAALAIKKDLMMTQSTNLTDGDPIPQSSVSMNWTDNTGFPSGNQTHSSTFVLSGTQLLRTSDNVTSIVARHITSLGFTLSGRVITVVITATSPQFPTRRETLKFTVYKRQDATQ